MFMKFFNSFFSPKTNLDSSALSQLPFSISSHHHASFSPIQITPQFLSKINSLVIRSSFLLSFYSPSPSTSPTPSFTCFQISPNEKLFLITSSHLISQIISYETLFENKKTIRKQDYKYNKSLLDSNPVSNSSLNNENYVKSQHKLFIKLSQQINFDHVIFPSFSSTSSIIQDKDIIKFVIHLTAQIYLPMLLNVESSKVLLVLDDFIELLNILEEATGKHGITFKDYLDHNKVEYSDVLEQQYIRLFHKIIVNLTNENDFIEIIDENSTLEFLCKDILSRLSTSNIVSVLSTTIDIEKNSVIMVNNILSWLDNMLNVVHTIVNLIVLVGQKNNGIYSKEFYNSSMPIAKALATMFMRHVIEPFQIIKENGYNLQFRQGDIIMMSNGNSDTIYGGNGRKCPSRPWSHSFMDKMMDFITEHYEIQYHNSNIMSGCLPLSLFSRTNQNNSIPLQCPDNNSWFWNKFSVSGIQLYPKSNQF